MPSFLAKIFDWNRHPAGVFVLVIPLALIGFSSLAMAAWLHWTLEGNPAYAIILAIGLALMGVALVPVWRMHQTSQKLAALAQRDDTNPSAHSRPNTSHL